MNNVSFFYNRNVIHPSLNISAKKYAEEWNNEFSNLINFFCNKFSNSISKIIDLENNSLKIYSDNIEYVDEYKLDNTIKLCEFFNFSLLATELEYFYVITLNNSLEDKSKDFTSLTKLFKSEIYSQNENKYNIPYMVVENFLEEKKEITQSSKKEIPSNTYPMTFINKISISNEFA
jgi:hypothetical protein